MLVIPSAKSVQMTFHMKVCLHKLPLHVTYEPYASSMEYEASVAYILASAKSRHLPSSLWCVWPSMGNVASAMNRSGTQIASAHDAQGAQDAQGDALIQPVINDAGIAAGVHGVALIHPSITGAGIAADTHPESSMGCRCDAVVYSAEEDCEVRRFGGIWFNNVETHPLLRMSGQVALKHAHRVLQSYSKPLPELI